MYKKKLGQYAEKAAIRLPPVYAVIKEGPQHALRFKAAVILNNVTYESPPGFTKKKLAEQAAAKVALDRLLQSSGGAKVVPSPLRVLLQQELGLCKSLLQEYAQKNRLPLPLYQSWGLVDQPSSFISVVEVAGVHYGGDTADTKKGAEIKAAKTALLAIQASESSPVARVGLAILMPWHLNNTSGSKPGNKRGRSAADVILDDPGGGRLRVDSHNA